MPIDDMPEDEVLRDTAADEAYQAAFDADSPAPYGDSNDARQWVRTALSVLTAAIPTEDMCPMQIAAVRDARVAALGRITRVMDLDRAPIDD